MQLVTGNQDRRHPFHVLKLQIPYISDSFCKIHDIKKLTCWCSPLNSLSWVEILWFASDGISFTTNMQGKTCVDHNFLSGVWCDDDG